jgi:uncharacterized membrane protein
VEILVRTTTVKSGCKVYFTVKHALRKRHFTTIMNSAVSPTTLRLSKQRLYRRLMFGFIAVGVVVGLVFRFLGYPLVGELIYWIGIIGFLAVWRGTSLTLFDERDRALEQQASQITLSVFAIVLVLGASAARVIPRISTYTVPTEFVGALYGYVALFVVFGVSYLWVQYRP